MKRNDERLGMEQFPPPSADAIEPTPSLDLPSPTDFAELPSLGLFYPEGHPLANCEDVEFRLMTAKQEDILTNKTLIRKGTVIDRVIQSVLVDRSLNADSLLIGDKNSLVLSIRISGYGASYSAKLTCPGCGEVIAHTFDLEKARRVNHGVARPEDLKNENGEEVITDVSPQGTFSILLPKTKVKLSCRLLTGADERSLAQLGENKKKSKLAESPMTDQMKQFVVSVNGNADKGAIARFIDEIPVVDSRFLREWYRKGTPNVTLVEDFVCSECGVEEEVPVPLGVEFFWPK